MSNPLRIHVVGCSSRSGTTLMHTLLTQSYGLVGADDHERSLVSKPPGPGPCCTKKPHDLPFARRLLALWPELHLVYLRRDPRDVITSRHPARPAVYWAPLRVWQSDERLARRLESHPRFHVVRYEDLIRDPPQVQAALELRCPLPTRQRDCAAYPWEAPTLHEHTRVALGSVRAMDTNGIGRWREHLPRLKAQVLLHGSPTPELIRLGYEADGAWERLLEEVAPDFAPGYLPERRSLHRHLRLRKRLRSARRMARVLLALRRSRGT